MAEPLQATLLQFVQKHVLHDSCMTLESKQTQYILQEKCLVTVLVGRIKYDIFSNYLDVSYRMLNIRFTVWVLHRVKLN